jgi:hypothetical protein
MKVPDAIEPAVGYRVWIVKDDRLYSVVHKNMWQPHMPFEAFCPKGHEVPDSKCKCGTYATATFNRLFDMGYTKESGNGLFSAPRGVVTIAGQVKLWGGIIPADTGWRAQFAYPKKLLVPYSRWRIAKQIAAAYDVPFKLYNLERKH